MYDSVHNMTIVLHVQYQTNRDECRSRALALLANHILSVNVESHTIDLMQISFLWRSVPMPPSKQLSISLVLSSPWWVSHWAYSALIRRHPTDRVTAQLQGALSGVHVRRTEMDHSSVPPSTLNTFQVQWREGDLMKHNTLFHPLTPEFVYYGLGTGWGMCITLLLFQIPCSNHLMNLPMPLEMEFSGYT